MATNKTPKTKKILSQIDKDNKAIIAAAKKEKVESIHRTFNMLMGALGIPNAQTEHIFHPERKWRLDYAWPDKKIAIEVEGGVFTRGRHTRGMGFTEDMVKYNQAVIYGWKIIRTTPDELMKAGTTDLIRQLHNQ